MGIFADDKSQRFIKIKAGFELFYAQSEGGNHYFWRKEDDGGWRLCNDKWCISIRHKDNIKNICIGRQDHALIIFNDPIRVIVSKPNGMITAAVKYAKGR